MSGAYHYKNAKIVPAENGYILCYDKYASNGEAYGSMQFVGECKKVYTDGSKAIKALDEIVSSEMYKPSLESKAVRSED